MSLYNLANGYNPACVLIMPMLGRTQYDWPRFRDCFLSKDENSIIIMTRVGGGNRKQGWGEEELYNDPNFIRTWDWEQDSTYGFYEFSPPEKWALDFYHIVAGEMMEVSSEYVELVKQFYPKLAETGAIDVAFCRKPPAKKKTKKSKKES